MFKKYLSKYYAPGTILSTGEAAETRINNFPALSEFIFYERQNKALILKLFTYYRVK